MLRRLVDLARELGLDPESRAYVPYGHDFAKIDTVAAGEGAAHGNLVVVSAVTPTPLGEGKTVTSISLGMGLARIGESALTCLRQPSLGPVFGAKGGGAGGGKAQVVPADRVNLGGTGDGQAVGAAHNLLAAMLDAHLRHGNALKIDPARIAFSRVTPVNDGSLRKVITGLGGPLNGVPRESFFEINEASEVMAILALAHDRGDLRRRLGNIVLGPDQGGAPVRAEQLGAAGAMSVLLRDALYPTLARTSEGTPVLLHAGPFANIAHGNSSLIATRWALTRAPWVVTECGFGTDLGLEKFVHIKARLGNLRPACVVVVCTVRALKVHAGLAKAVLGKPLDQAVLTEDVSAVEKGAANLRHHLRIATDFGPPVVVALNRFPSDTEAEIAVVEGIAREFGAGFAVHSGFADGGAGAEELARAVVKAARPTDLRYQYEGTGPLLPRLESLAKNVYGATGIELAPSARTRLNQLEKWGLGELQLCVAKTHLATTHDPADGGLPKPFTLPVRDVLVRAGAGFATVLTGELTTLPALGARPNAVDMDLDPVTGAALGL
ncbi:Formate-tetrahydrofolate ligase [Nannocystis exedens]|uniref:Formate--tetrahydrofolate ligase n=1 Tax=Nannocystis exedens TaxID=54 RepID=A0A1I2BEE4_9BACT|nr:formate--tetrahydrofolate ligase [Nannocystis exedens]PCC68062.1 formate-tetrahydrofolate ligase [Nannocystis exedens]SFE53673.1 Formate-tetrahydrofolate ligase [Nannocystis exedens]